MKLCSVILIGGLLAACMSGADNLEQATVYYYPFEYTVSGIITEANIEKGIARRGKIQVDSRQYRRLMSLLRSGSPGSFQSEFVRAKIAPPNGPVIFIDAGGGVDGLGEGPVVVSDETMNEIGDILKGVTENIDGGPDW